MKSGRIEIKDPCQQNWNSMPAVEGGIYCSRCTKVVRDFTAMSDEALIEFLSRKHDSEVCGKFSKDQLEKTYLLPEQRPQQSHTSLKLLMAGLLALPLYSQAQTGTAKHPGEKVRPLKRGIQAPLHRTIIKGRVFDRSSRQGIAANIKLYSDNSEDHLLATIATDSSGHYQLYLPDTSLGRFFRIVYSASDNYQERFIVVDHAKIPAYLPVSLMFTPTAEIVTTYVAQETHSVLGGVSVERVEYVKSYGGINPHVVIVAKPPRYKRLWYRVRGFVIRTFRKK